MALPDGRSYGAFRGNVRFLHGDYILPSTYTGKVVADSTTTQAGGTQIIWALNIVSSGGAGYSVVLPPAQPGMKIDILLSTASNTVKVYPNAGGTGSETINALSANSAITMAALSSATFCCVEAGAWFTNPRVPS